MIFVRFGHLFEEKDLLMATATHPAHTLHAIYRLAEQHYTTVKERLVRELVDIVNPSPRQEAATDQGGDQHFCYDDLYGPSTSTTPANNSTQEEAIKLEVMNWVRDKDHVVRKEQFPAGHRDAWVKLFIKYNTSLPSSAAAERLFSTAGNILRPKRSSLTANNFEQLVMLKGNSQNFKTFLKNDLKKNDDTDLK